MNYANAETASDIARLLRSHQEMMVVTAPRHVGKTTELLKFAEQKNPNGQFAVVCLDAMQQNSIIRRHWMLFNRIDQADIVAKRLLGEPLGGIDVNPPLVLTPQNIHFLRGRKMPVYVDEWGLLGARQHANIIETGLFVAAVTS